MSIPAKIVLASDDLQARARVLDALEAPGRTVVTTGATGFGEAARGAEALILDLDRGGRAALDELAAMEAGGEGPQRVFGFFSHIDADLGRDARAAGCLAMPRGKFWRTLPGLLDQPASGPSS